MKTFFVKIWQTIKSAYKTHAWLKWISIGLVAIIAISVIAGTANNSSTDNSTPHNSSLSEESISEDSSEQTPTQSESNSNTENNKTDELTFTALTVVDNAECFIEVTAIDPDNIFGYTLKVLLENKSNDKTYMFSITNASINGIQCDPYFASDVAPNKKANEQIYFSDNIFEENGIKVYTDIELTFNVYDSNDWTADSVAEKTVHIYPYGKDKATKYIRPTQPSDNIIIDNEYITVIVTGYENDEIWGYTVNLFLLNKSNKNLMLSVDEASINGFMADPFYAEDVSANKCAFSSISWSDTTLEENGISNIEEIEFLLRVYDSDNWLNDDFANETIILNP